MPLIKLKKWNQTNTQKNKFIKTFFLNVKFMQKIRKY